MSKTTDIRIYLHYRPIKLHPSDKHIKTHLNHNIAKDKNRDIFTHHQSQLKWKKSILAYISTTKT